MTGSKGLGRLSVQFLADEMRLESNCDAGPDTMLYAEVDWRKVQSGEDLQTVDVEWVCAAQRSTYADDSATGTRITLAGLRTEWDGTAIEELGKDVWMLRSPFRSGEGQPKARQLSTSVLIWLLRRSRVRGHGSTSCTMRCSETGWRESLAC